MTGRAVLGRVDVVEILNLDALLRELGFSLVAGFAFEAERKSPAHVGELAHRTTLSVQVLSRF